MNTQIYISLSQPNEKRKCKNNNVPPKNSFIYDCELFMQKESKGRFDVDMHLLSFKFKPGFNGRYILFFSKAV